MIDTREKLIDALTEAAELEHDLLLQYLFAVDPAPAKVTIRGRSWKEFLAMTRYVLVFLVVCCLGSLTAGADRKPNVVVILSDDQGWGDLSLNGNTNLKTPHVDSLATAGARFDRFFVQPVCSPTRAEFLTGRYHPRGGVRDRKSVV